VRKLEFLMGEALSKGAKKVVTFGGVHSNHVRQTASAARKLGLEPILFILGKRPEEYKGNLLLDRLYGAELKFVDLGEAGGRMTIETADKLMRAMARLFPSVGWRKTYIIPVGGHSPVGCLGYVNAAFELAQQAEERNLKVDYVVTAVGTGGTMAGLMAGFRLLGAGTKVIGVDVGRLWKGFRGSIAHITAQVAELLGEKVPFREEDVLLYEDYVGEAYAHPTPECWEAIRLLARKEGLVLDPIYTGKAMAGLIDLIRKGVLKEGETVVFLHTGGSPSLYAFEF
jgi:D-cysteine desulfhydrase